MNNIAWLERELTEVQRVHTKALVMIEYLTPLHEAEPWADVRHPDEPGRSFEDWRLLRGNCARAIADYERRLRIARMDAEDR